MKSQRNDIITFENVTMRYPLYSHFGESFKSFLFNLPQSLIRIRKKRFTALEKVSFAIQKGENVGIIGRNGAGKSTLLGLIAGILRPTEGKIIVKGRVSPFLELGAGFHSELTGRENIELNGVLMGLRRYEVFQVMQQIIDFSELGPFIDQPVRTYSSGMLTRLGFSVVAHVNPDILLIDEVLAVGDISFKRKCIERMSEFKESSVTMIFVSHSMDDIKTICNKVMWIDEHRLKIFGEPEEAISAYHRALTYTEKGK